MGTVDLVDLGNDTIIIAGSGRRQHQTLGLRGAGVIVPFCGQGRIQVIEDEVAMAGAIILIRGSIVWRVLLLLLVMDLVLLLLLLLL